MSGPRTVVDENGNVVFIGEGEGALVDQPVPISPLLPEPAPVMQVGGPVPAVTELAPATPVPPTVTTPLTGPGSFAQPLAPSTESVTLGAPVEAEAAPARQGRGNGQPPAPTTPEEVAAAEAAVEAARIEEEKKSFRMSDEEYTNLRAWYGVQQDRGVALERQVPGEVETANRAAALQEEYATQLRQNADNILDSMETARARQEEAQEDMRVKAESLFSRGFNARSIYQSPDRAANIGVSLGIAVGAMLQQFNNSLHPGQNAGNAALQMVEQAQEADIAQQREMFRRGQLGLESDNAAMTAMRELGADEVTAFEFARHQAGENLASQLEALATAHAGTRLAADLTDRAAVLRQQSMDRRGRIEMQMAQLAARQVRRGGPRRPAYGVQFGDDRDVAIRPAGYDFTVTNDPEVQRRQMAYASNPELQKKVTAAVNGLTSFRSIMRRIDTYVVRGRGGGVTILPESRGQLESAAGEAALALKEAYSMGALGADVLEITTQLIGNPASIFNDTSALLLRLRRMGGSAAEQQRLHLDTHGLGGRSEFEDVATAGEVTQNRVGHTDADAPTQRIQGERDRISDAELEADAAENSGGTMDKVWDLLS